jgi:hypothetical protein
MGGLGEDGGKEEMDIDDDEEKGRKAFELLG